MVSSYCGAICLDLVGIGLGLHIICTGGDRSYMK